MALQDGPRDGEGMPSVEAPREIVEHYNQHNLEGFDKVGYFIFNGVKVFEDGKKEAIKDTDKLSMEQKLFGKAKL